MVRPIFVRIKLPPRVDEMSGPSGTDQNPPNPQPQSVRTKGNTPLPRYTSIDLESEIPDLYNTSLNPAIHDPDMTMFFNRNAPPFHTNYAKRHSPPPSYSSRNKQGSISSTATSSTISSQKKVAISRRNFLAGCFLCVFIAAPLVFLIVFYMIPRIVIIDVPKRY